MFNQKLNLNKISHTTQLMRAATLALALGSVSLSGCSYLEPYKAPIVQGNVMTQEAVSLLQQGLSKSQVVELLGPPLGEHPFNPNHWEYTYYTNLDDAKTKKYSRHLVLNFDQDQYLDNWKETEHTASVQEDDSWLGLDWF